MKRFRNCVFSVVFFMMASAVWAQTAAPAKSKASAKSPSAVAAATKQVDINSASMSELMSIPGIGDAYATKIMAGRPYKTKSQLKSRNVLPNAVYEKTKDWMVAKQK